MNPLYSYLNSTNPLLQVRESQKNRTDSANRKTVRQTILVNYLDLDSGLLDKLLGVGLVTWDEFDDIRTTGSQRSRNEKLLNAILNRDMYERFLNLLKETQHGHLIDYQNDADYYRRLARGDIPLTRREETILDINREVIIEVINDSKQLAQQLFAEGVLNEKQRDRICSSKSGIERSEMLLEVIRRRSVKDFQATIHCLRDTHQSHVADILEGGVTCRVTSHLESGTEPIDEDAIVSGFLKELNDREYLTDGSAHGNLNLLRLGLKYVRRSNGILLYFHFRSVKELQALRTEYESGSLRQKAEKDFFDLTRFPTGKVNITVEWPEYDYRRCTFYFSLLPSTTIDDLPLEILDMILQKSNQFLKLLGNKAINSSDAENFISMAQVSNCWFQRLLKSVFQKVVDRNYKAEILKLEKRSAIIRNNRKYLSSEIQPHDLIHHLVQSGCLAEKQATFLRGLRYDIDKNRELLKIARKFSFRKHRQFVDCLYLTDQLNVARVVETGGVTVKVSIGNAPSANVHAPEKHLVGKLHKMLREGSDEKLWPHKLFNSVNIYDVIFQSVQERGELIDLWLWCRSQEALEMLRELDEGELLKITEQLFSGLQSSASFKPQNAFINPSYFKCDVVVRRISTKLRESFYVSNDGSPSGLTNLRDRIYITIGSKVFIHEADAPYRQLEKTITLPGIRLINSVEVMACTVNECLYINDPDTDGIWKIVPANDHERTQWMSHLTEVMVSTSSAGEVLILDTNHSCPNVRVFSHDAVLKRTVPIRLRTSAYSIRSAAVEVMPEIVAVCFEFAEGTKVRQGIVVARLNETGQVLREVEWMGLSSIGPHSVGRIIAIDGGNKRVVLLDYQLCIVQVLMSNDDIGSRWPNIWCYRSENRELMIDHFGHTGQIDIYKLDYDEEGGA